MGELARGILSKDIVLLAVKVSQLSVELKMFGLLVKLLNGTNSCAKQLSAEVSFGNCCEDIINFRNTTDLGQGSSTLRNTKKKKKKREKDREKNISLNSE